MTVRQTDISFCLPVYNVRPYIEDCINSIEIACNKDINYEILCIDDRSTDGSYELLLDLAKEKSYIKVFRNIENKGVSFTRNRMVRHAVGEYIWFVDPDDMLIKNVAVLFLEQIRRLECDVLLGNYIRIPESADSRECIINEKTVVDIIPYQGESFLPLDTNKVQMCAVWGGLFKRSFLLYNNLTMNEKMIAQEDTLFYYQFSLKTNNIYKWEIPCYLYRQRIGSAMNSHSEERSKKYYFSMREMLRVYQEHLDRNEYDNIRILSHKIHHSKQNVITCLAMIHDSSFIRSELRKLKSEGVYPYKFRKQALKAPQPCLLRILTFLIPLPLFFWVYHYMFYLYDKLR